MPGQDAQRLFLVRSQFPGDLINHAQSPEAVAVRCYQWCSGVKTDLRIGSDQGVFGKTFVLGSVGNDEQVWLVDGVGANRNVPRGFLKSRSEAGLEPLPALVDHRNQRDGSLANNSRQFGEVVE